MYIAYFEKKNLYGLKWFFAHSKFILVLIWTNLTTLEKKYVEQNFRKREKRSQGRHLEKSPLFTQALFDVKRTKGGHDDQILDNALLV